MRLFALGIDQARDVFGASDQLAGRLRTVAGEKFARPVPAQKRRLRIFGPLHKRDDQLVIDPADPTPADLDALLQGRYLPPDRLPAAWRALELWFGDLAFGELDVPITKSEFDQLEFDLARVGLPSPFALGQLLQNDAALPIMSLPDMSVGYSKTAHVLNTAEALASAVDHLTPQHAAVARRFLSFLEQFPAWSRLAQQEARPEPDLLAIWHRA